MNQLNIRPSFDEIVEMVNNKKGNTIPVYQEMSADMLTPVSAYLKISNGKNYSFMLESIEGGEQISRYSFIGADPYKIIRSGQNEELNGDPLVHIQKEMDNIKYVSLQGLPQFTGGAIGYISYDCVQYFEPRTARELKDNIGVPDMIMLLCNTLVVFDHLKHVVKFVSHVKTEDKDLSRDEIKKLYDDVVIEINKVITTLQKPDVPVPVQKPIILNQKPESNTGKEGYERFVTELKRHIIEGDIIQAVPSQRISKKTTLHPFNAYRHLRSINPSPYMFYIDLKEFQIVGASPEMLVKVDDNKYVHNHPIAGTRPRGKTPEEDDALAIDLLSDVKECAEHVMLVDLGRNDINRICQPNTVAVTSLMHIEKYSHVMHIVSNVIGKLRDDKTSYDAFRSIFPAGTLSGAPKIKAMELIYELENERRGVYGGAVGHFDYSGALDTCIAIRTMVFKDETVYLQAGAGIVYDSVPEKEYQETLNKLMANVTALENAEKFYYNQQQAEKI